ncbi:thymidylate synthase [Luteolibacter sp. GHJ8]|uniref:thymidylate synthase n=1 Tax=Luteolibacter rhizosphaerae TaxID=2989719 RepID=A0ABT3FZ22_9BACT|nr:thymidylate synthase [Luteolibacter rhizosphaerae]MCW1912832.1 thymidylate synthase [Luteolibacter rhizosphaerae]
MFNLFDGPTADDVWLRIVAELSRGCQPLLGGRGGEFKELLHTAISVSDPRERWVVSRQPTINPAFAIAEIVWILAGRNDSAFLNYFNSTLPRFAGEGESYHGAYGYRLRKHFSVDQLAVAFESLANNPQSRQVVLQIWDPQSDLPLNDGSPASPDVPCNLSSVLKIRDGALEWLQIMRSNDVYLGFPHNVIQFTMLQEVLAGWLGLRLGSYNHVSDSLHVYRRDLDLTTNVGKISMPSKSDRFNDNYADTQKYVGRLASLVEDIIDPGNLPLDLLNKLSGLRVSPGWFNYAAILTAEACRRRQDIDSVSLALELCGNQQLRFIFSCWLKRVAP